MITNAQVKFATIEYLSHQGMDPHRIRPGGQALWEVYAPAMRAVLTAVLVPNDAMKAILALGMGATQS